MRHRKDSERRPSPTLFHKVMNLNSITGIALLCEFKLQKPVKII